MTVIEVAIGPGGAPGIFWAGVVASPAGAYAGPAAMVLEGW